MLDVAPRMVELARSRGVDAIVGDVQELPFENALFDCAVAAWMLFHVPDIDRGLSELARVLRPGGRLVAVTNAEHHLAEPPRRSQGARPGRRRSRARTEPRSSSRHFRACRAPRRGRLDHGRGRRDRPRIRRVARTRRPRAQQPPYELPLRARRATSVFVAERGE